MNNPIFISSFVILFAFIYLYERGERSATTFSKFSRASEKGLQFFLQCFDILRDQRGHTVFIFAHIDSGHRFFNSVTHLRSVQENFMQSRQALSDNGRFRIIEKRHHLIEHRIDLAKSHAALSFLSVSRSRIYSVFTLPLDSPLGFFLRYL